MAFKVVNNVVVTDTEDGQLENLSIDGTSVLVGDGAGNVTLQNVTISSSVGIGSLNINDLGDVDTVSTLPVNGDALVWNSTSSVWEPQAPFSQADFDTAFALKTTTNLTEGSNLYYTTTRANTDFDTRLATKTTANLTEGSNLYFTDERVDDRVANLLVAGTNIVLSYDDSAGTLTVNASSTGGYDLSSNTTTDLTEGTNLYYTTARANTDIDARVTTSFVNALNVTAASVQADSVTLGTDTTGNYVATITGTTNEVEVTGSGTETAAVTIGLPNDVTISNDLTVSGNLTVNGTTVTVNVATLEVEDKDIVVAKNATTSGAADGAGLIIGSSVATMLYQSSGDKFVMNKSLDTDLIGNADTATALATARAIQVSGAVTGTANFDGTAGINIVTTATSDPTLTLAGDLSGSATFTNLGNATLTATIAANSVALGTDTTGNYVGAGATSGNGISGSVSSEGGTFTVTSNATSANTANTIVFRNASGNFNAGTITGSLSGNATTADTADTSREIQVYDGDARNAWHYPLFTNGTASTTAGQPVDRTVFEYNFFRFHPLNGDLSIPGEFYAGGDVTAYFTSDVTLKENVVEIKNALDKVKSIRGVTFDWKDEVIERKGGEDGYFVRKQDVGVIAQEVEEVLPEVVGTKENGIKAVRYEKLVALLIEAMKEQQIQIETLRTEISLLKDK